jgi:23S rRNA pseudouridine2605 synthase
MRLNRAIALAAICSRRAADRLIEAGRVLVNDDAPNGAGMSVVESDCIKVDNKKIFIRQEHLYYMYNKPKGYVCSRKRLYPGQNLIYDLIDAPGLFTVGRLDKDTTGLILLTTDGEFAQGVIHPSRGTEKEYLVKVHGMYANSIKLLGAGVVIDGVRAIPKIVKKVGPDLIKIVIMEGKNREVRRLCQNASLNILSLKRVRIGPLKLNTLQEDTFSAFDQRQIYSLFNGNKRACSSK